ncbi:Uncharacterised protein [Orientia tsutsugamushi]|uniref:Uncharacterized protein n=1 Tax=Orientia tsutsugamushi TaxID=784 RepID=A0A2U3RM95_ORITS|nr:hypothetical protein OTSKARP_1350 [Orientia tsutsugamushi str. Karp]SPR14359.1 Uncharacterised protein [Orientia tsutsugamushi]
MRRRRDKMEIKFRDRITSKRSNYMNKELTLTLPISKIGLLRQIISV